MRTYVRANVLLHRAEHDPVKTWIVLGPLRRMTVELDDGENFFQWASQAWPKPQYEVTLDPWQLSPVLARDRRYHDGG